VTTSAVLAPPTAPHPAVRVSTPLLIAAQAAVISAAIHAWIVPEHLREWWLYGAFFLGVAIAQSALAILLLRRPTLPVLLAGIWGNVGLISTYVASRTVGLPVTPPHDAAAHVHTHLPVAGGVGNGIPIYPGATESHVEAIGLLDLPALAAELVLVVMLLGLLPTRLGRRTTNVLLVGGIAAWVLRAIVPLT
jgi:hypothetical protein